MPQAQRQKPKKSKADQIDIVIGLLNAGRTQAAAAEAIGVNLRTVQRWLTEPEVKARLEQIKKEVQAIAKTDPVVVAINDIHQQIDDLLAYRESQKRFSIEMGEVVFRSLAVIKKAVERLELNPDEVSVRLLPSLLKVVLDASEKLSGSWSRAVALENLLEKLNDPKTGRLGQEDT